MKLLILGGTRFIGAEVLMACIEHGYDVSYVSRRPHPRAEKATYYAGEREKVVPRLAEKYYDIVIDFIAYSPDIVAQSLKHIRSQKYLLISTAWLSQMELGLRSFLPHEARYALSKIATENLLLAEKRAECSALVLRFPITLGIGDHSGRLNYLTDRLSRNIPLIKRQDKECETAILSRNDAVEMIVQTLQIDWKPFEIVEALPPICKYLK